MADSPATVDEYIAAFAPERQDILRGVRAAIHAGIGDATEKIRYGMPAVMIGSHYGLHFAGWKKHLALYPVPVFEGQLEDRLTAYRTTKDAVAFNWNEAVPFDLIEAVARAVAVRRQHE